MTNKKQTADEIAALRAEVDALKAAQPQRQQTWEEIQASAAKFRDEMHQLREGRANVVPSWLREACAGGVTDADARGIAAARHAPTGPSSQGAIPSSQQVSNVRGTGGIPGGGTGWAHSVPLTADPSDRKSLAERCAPKGNVK